MINKFEWLSVLAESERSMAAARIADQNRWPSSIYRKSAIIVNSRDQNLSATLNTRV
jgi:hypothetical protein